MKPAIEIYNLSKKYRLKKAERYLSLRDTITNNVKNIFRSKDADKKDFWALKDINLRIEQGDRIGIIGKNGSGKSTLLKILSRITPPTKGEAIIRGRLASLLEVGTGFHPELTGRENIYLNGSILGLKKHEIEKQFDAIIDFSGVEAFLDTPLKNFSSGMQLRLAFAVAAHLEPEILLVDEVLAVGDIEFQKKCIGKMEEVSKQQGRTILFVSHILSQIRNVCTSGILLDAGEIACQGKIEDVIKEYTGSFAFTRNAHWTAPEGIDTDFYIREAILKVNGAVISEPVDQPDMLKLEISVHARKSISNSLIEVRISNQENVAVYTTTNADQLLRYANITPGDHTYRVALPTQILIPGRYSLQIAWYVPNMEDIFTVDQHLFFEVSDERYAGDVLNDGRAGILNKTVPWEMI